MTRKKLLLILLVGLLVGGAVTIALLDRDKRLTFRVAEMRYDREHYVRFLVGHYYKGNDRVKKRVLTIFERMDPSPTADFIEIAKEDDPLLQAAAVTLLLNAGADKFAKLLEVFDDDPAIQAGVANALIRAGAGIVPSLETAAVTPNRPVQWWAITTLRNMGPAASKAAKSLNSIAANDPDTVLRAAATEALGATGEAAVPYVPDIVKALEHDDPEVRASAARALGMIGLSARDTLADLTSALRDDDAIVRENAWAAILRIQAALSSHGSRLCDLSASAR
jgi:HEAT repeat protein